MKVLEIDDNDKANYMELLLIADEQISMIEKYLYRGEMFALYDDDVKAVCVVTEQEPGFMKSRILLQYLSIRKRICKASYLIYC